VSPEEPEPLAVDTARVLEIGIALWGVALVVSLLVTALHQGGRHWWPWACVAGIVGGGIALLYVRRGRGNAAAARPGSKA
jgi:membrane protease YdiL (CAAX protease family)